MKGAVEKLLAAYAAGVIVLCVAVSVAAAKVCSPGRLMPTSSPGRTLHSSGSVAWQSHLFDCLSGSSATQQALRADLPVRLAGTFFVYPGGADGTPRASAVLDLINEGRQVVAGVGEVVAGYRITRIQRDRALLTDRHGRSITLYVTPLTRTPTPSPVPTREPADEPTAQPVVLADGTLLGHRVSSNRWVLRADQLRHLYDEVSRDPRKMAGLFLSFEDVLDDRSRTTGYQLMPVVGHDFFQALGLRTGDVIRCVNSMRMTSTRRAQYFVREFAAGRLGAVVLDIERNGETNKLIYLIR